MSCTHTLQLHSIKAIVNVTAADDHFLLVFFVNVKLYSFLCWKLRLQSPLLSPPFYTTADFSRCRLQTVALQNGVKSCCQCCRTGTTGTQDPSFPFPHYHRLIVHPSTATTNSSGSTWWKWAMKRGDAALKGMTPKLKSWNKRKRLSQIVKGEKRSCFRESLKTQDRWNWGG